MYEHLGTDILVVEQDFSVLPTGDVEQVAGLRCLMQDLVHRLGTPRGDHFAHPDYGLDIQRFLHLEARPVHVLDFRRSVEAELERDPRVVPGSARCDVLGWELDHLRFRAQCLPVGATNPLNLVLGYNLNNITLEVARG
jgi:hypothetical protein